MEKFGSIAVLMSVYIKERPEYLDLAMKSLWIDQTLKPSQIIIIQDGDLTPDLLAVLDKWRQIIPEDIFVYHKNDENLGLTKSMNIGIKYVKEKYIARIDSDDICLPEKFEKQYEYLESHPEISILGTQVQEIDADGQYTKLRFYPLTNKEVIRYIPRATPLQHSNVMMRTQMFRNGISYNERFRMTQDLALWFDALCAGYKIANIPDCLFLFRISNETMRRRNRTKAYNEFKIYMNGIWRLYGFTWRYIYPITRLCFRLMPKKILKLIYNSNVRSFVLK